MKKPILLILLGFALSANAQLFVASGTSLDVRGDGEKLFSNESIENEGTINVTDGAILEFDANLTNDGVMNYGTSDFGLLKIGSGQATSGQSQALRFNATVPSDDESMPVDEFIPLIELNKTGGTAAIARGHVRLTEKIVVTSGDLDAESSITGTSTINEAPNTDPGRVISKGLTFASPNATKTAIVGQSVNGTLTNVIVERFVPSSNRAFRLFTSSVDIDGTISSDLQEGGQVLNIGDVENPRPGYGTHVTGVSTIAGNNNFNANPASVGLDVTNTGNPGMYSWGNDTQAFSPILASNDILTNLTAGEPYLFFIRGDRSLNLSSNTQVGGATTLRTLGNIKVGQVIEINPVTADADGLNFFGNPYQAQINSRTVLLKDQTTLNADEIIVYDPKLGIHGDFVTIDISDDSNDGVPSTPNNDPTNFNKFIQPNQAFFVRSKTSNAAFAFFEESDKIESTTTIDIFSDEMPETRLYVSLHSDDAQHYTDGVLIRYSPTFSDAVNYSDGIKLWNQYENLAIFNSGASLEFDKRDINGNMDNVLLNVYNYNYTNYHFEIDTENLGDLENAYLIDHYLNTETELVEGANSYTFSIDQNVPASTDANRFEIGINVETLGVDNPSATTEFSLYPNPASTSVMLSLSGLADNFEQVQVVSVDGKLVKAIELDNLTSYQMDISTLSSGVYLVQATTQNSQFTQKLIVE